MEVEKLLYEIRFENGLICPRCEGKEVTAASWEFNCKSCRKSGKAFRFGLFTNTALGKTKFKPEVVCELVLKYIASSSPRNGLKAHCSSRSLYPFFRKISGTLSSRFFWAEGNGKADVQSCRRFYFRLTEAKIQLCNEDEADFSVINKRLDFLRPENLSQQTVNFFYSCLENTLVICMKRKTYFEHLFSWIYLYNIGFSYEELQEDKFYKVLKELLKVEKAEKV